MITADSVTKFFPTGAAGSPALRNVSLDVEAGSILGVFGDARSGKSVLINLLGLQDHPDTGVVKVNDVTASSRDARALREVRRQFSAVDPSFLLRDERTVAGNIATPLEQLGVDGPTRRAKVAALLDVIGLSRAGGSQPTELSEGQRRRVAIGRALAVSPSVLLIEDPTAGLDEAQAAGVQATIDRVRSELGLTVLIATDDPDVIRGVCDSVAVLDRGRLVEAGPVWSLLTESGSAIADTLLPTVSEASRSAETFDQVADVVLIGHAAVDSIIASAADCVGVEVTTLDGGTSLVAETPVARYRIGLRGGRSDIALGWIAEHGGAITAVHRTQRRAVSRPAGDRHLTVAA